MRLSAAARRGLVVGSSWREQVYSLLLLRWRLAARNWRSTAAQLLSGAVIVLLLLSFQAVADFVLGARELHPPALTIGQLPACVAGRGAARANADGSLSPGCNTVLYAPSTPAISALLRRVAARAGLDFDVHFVAVPGASSGPPFDLHLADAMASNASACIVGGCGRRGAAPSRECLPCALIRDNATLTAHLLAHPGGTQSALWFLGAYAAPAVADHSYALLYNYTLTVAPFNAPSRALELTRALQVALLETAADAAWPGGPASSFNYSVALKTFPQPPPRVAGYDVFAANGGQWLFVVPALAFFHVLTELVHEKEARLRVGMRQMGLRTSAFWAAWLCYGAALCIVGTSVLQIAGVAARFDFYVNASTGVTFTLFLAFSAAMLSLAVLLSTTMTSTRTAQTVGYSFLLVGFLLQFVITSSYAGVIALLYAQDAAWWVRGARLLLQFYPAFNFSKEFADIAARAASTVSTSAGSVTRGPGFTWSDLFVARQRGFAGFVCELPPPVDSLGYQLLDATLFLALALYLDAVLPGPQGTPAHPLFCCGWARHTRRAGGSAAAPAARRRSRAGIEAGSELAESEDSDAEGDADTTTDSPPDDGVVAESWLSERCTTSLPPVPAATLVEASTAAGVAAMQQQPRRQTILVRVSHLRVVYGDSSGGAQRCLGRAFSRLVGYGDGGAHESRRCCFGRRLRSATSAATVVEMAPTSRTVDSGDDDSQRDSGATVVGGATAVAHSHRAARRVRAAGVVVAVRDLSLTVRHGEVLALLGHNGCGKSSTLSVLTGLYAPSGGIVEVAGHDVTLDVAAVQRHVGVCPQHDILWPQLTAAETLSLFAVVKGIAAGARADEVARVLRAVRLSAVAHRPVGTLSGGMKRRVSVAIAALGAPPVIFLDEPTTGMDPVNRQGVWRLIQRLKRDAGVVLTTHDMSEANVLGDRVAIMAGGRLVALGSPLHLKNAYGTGYCVTMRLVAADDATAAAVVDGIRNIVPEAAVSLRDSASLAVVVPFAALDAMPRVLDWIDGVTGDGPKGVSNSGSGGGIVSRPASASAPALVREYGVSGPTLEAVFIAISARAHFALAQEAQTGGATQHSGDAPGLIGATSPASPVRIRVATHTTAAAAEPLALAPSHDTAAVAVVAASDASSRTRRTVTFAPSAARTRTSTDIRLEELPPPTGVAPAAAAVRRAPWLYQHRALAHKNLLLLTRSRGLFLCQIVTPLLVLGLLLVLQGVIAGQVGRVSITDIPTLLMPLNLNQLVGSVTSVPPPPRGAMMVGEQVDPPLMYPHDIVTRVAALSDSATARRYAAPPALSRDYGGAAATANGAPLSSVDGNSTDDTIAIDTDCLEFFLLSIAPDYSPAGGGGDDTPSALARRIGVLPRQYLPDGYNASAARGAYPRANGSGLLGNIRTAWCTLKNGSRVVAPYFDARSATDGSGTSDALDVELMADLLVLNNASSFRLSQQPPCAPSSQSRTATATQAAEHAVGASPAPSAAMQPHRPSRTPLPYNPSTESWLCPAYILPDGTLEVHAMAFPGPSGGNAKPGTYTLALSLRANDSPVTLYHRPSNFSRVGYPRSTAFQAYAAVAVTIDPARLALLDMAWRGFAASAGFNMSQLDSMPIVARDPGEPRQQQALQQPPRFPTASIIAVGNMPFTQVANLLQIVEIVGAVLYPITLALQLPLFITVTVLEKEERLTELQRAMGLSMSAHYVVTYLINLALYAAVSGAFWGAAAALRFTFFSQTSPVLLGVALLGWGLSLVSSSQLIAAFLNSRKTATILGYVLALFSTLLAVLVAAGIYGSATSYGLRQPLPLALYVVPVFGLARFLYLGTYACIALQQCLDDAGAALFGPGEVRAAVWSMYLVAVVYWVLALYLEAVLPRPHGVPRHPLWFLQPDDNAAKAAADEAAAAAAVAAASRRGWSGLASPAAWLRARWARARVDLAGFVQPPPTGEEAAVAALLANPTPELLAPLLQRAANATDAHKKRVWAPLGSWLTGRGRHRRRTREESVADDWGSGTLARSLSLRSTHYFPPNESVEAVGAAAPLRALAAAAAAVVVASAPSRTASLSTAAPPDEERATAVDAPSATARLRIAVPLHSSTNFAAHPQVQPGGAGHGSAVVAAAAAFAPLSDPAPTPRGAPPTLMAAPAVPPLSSRITRHGNTSTFFSGGQRGPTLTDVVAVLSAAGTEAPLAPVAGSPRADGGAGRPSTAAWGTSSHLQRGASLRLRSGESRRGALLAASPRRSDDGGWSLSWAEPVVPGAVPGTLASGAVGDARAMTGQVMALDSGDAGSNRAALLKVDVDDAAASLAAARDVSAGNNDSASADASRLPPPGGDDATPGAGSGAAVASAAGEGMGPGALFAYVRRVLVLAKATLALPLPAAVAAYADGEDADVLAERRLNQASVWPAVSAQLDDGGGVRSGRAAQTAAAGTAAARAGRSRSRSRGVSGGASSQARPRSVTDGTADAATGAGGPGTASDDAALLLAVTADAPAVAAAAAPPGTETIFDRYPIILRHMRKEFGVPVPDSSRPRGRGCCSWRRGIAALRRALDAAVAAAAACLPRGFYVTLGVPPAAYAASQPRRRRARSGDVPGSSLTVAVAGRSSSRNVVPAPSRVGMRRRRRGGSGDDAPTLGIAQPPPPLPAAIDVEQRLLAAVGVKVAVSDMTLAVARGECLGLLGENGAGKTTVVSMLTGMLAASAGDAFVGGWHVHTETDAVRTAIGICPQADTLWPSLTVREHLDFYSRVKGVPPGAPLAAAVDAALARVGLTPFASRRSAALSGGQRRRLSLAIALAGEPDIVFADEPGTGLDAASRRAVWRVLAAACVGRVVVLVSHDMHEVEVLATRIGIMTFGRLRCLGDQQHLKAAYGGGYRLAINYNNDADAAGAGPGGEPAAQPPPTAAPPLVAELASATGRSNTDGNAAPTRGVGGALAAPSAGAAERALRLITSLFPGSVLDVAFDGFASFILPSVVPVSRVFQLMSQHAAAGGVTDWGVSQVTLDTIFQRIVRHYRGPGGDDLDDDDDDEADAGAAGEEEDDDSDAGDAGSEGGEES